MAPTRFLAPSALLPEGWAEDVLLEVGSEGALTTVRPGAADAPPAREAIRLPGPVLPGVPNVHSHAFQRALAGRAERGSADGDTFWSWRRQMYRFLARLDPDAVEAVATWLYVEMLEAGYTSVGEFHYLHHGPDGAPYAEPAAMAEALARASRSAGIGLTLLPTLYAAGGFGGEPPQEGQRRFVTDVDGFLSLLQASGDALSGDGDRRIGVALHSLRAVPPDALREVLAAVADRDDAPPVHIHVAEQRAEVEACLAWSGRRPVAWLLEHAPVGQGWCLVHATHVEPDELEGIARSGAVVGLCPTTEANLGDGLFPLPDYMAAGGRLGIGSDSHVSVSPVEELRWLEYGQRLVREARNVAAGARDRSTGRVLFDGVVRGGAAALGRAAGALEPGARADWIVLDGEHPVLAGAGGDGVLDAWIFSGNVPLVREVAVGGRVVVREGRHPDREAAAERFRRVMRGLTG